MSAGGNLCPRTKDDKAYSDARPARDLKKAGEALASHTKLCVVRPCVVGQALEPLELSVSQIISIICLPYDVGPARAFLGEAEKTPWL